MRCRPRRATLQIIESTDLGGVSGTLFFVGYGTSAGGEIAGRNNGSKAAALAIGSPTEPIKANIHLRISSIEAMNGRTGMSKLTRIGRMLGTH